MFWLSRCFWRAEAATWRTRATSPNARNGRTINVRNVRSVSVAQEPPEPTLETATVTRGDIVLTADGSGELVPTAELELMFRTGGGMAGGPTGVGSAGGGQFMIILNPLIEPLEARAG